MSKKSKVSRSANKRAERKARKALYANQASESKQKKVANRIGQFNAWKHAHLNPCGNIGCSKCFPRLTLPSSSSRKKNLARLTA